MQTITSVECRIQLFDPAAEDLLHTLARTHALSLPLPTLPSSLLIIILIHCYRQPYMTVAWWDNWSELWGWGFISFSGCKAWVRPRGSYMQKTSTGQRLWRAYLTSVSSHVPWRKFFIFFIFDLRTFIIEKYLKTSLALLCWYQAQLR